MLEKYPLPWVLVKGVTFSKRGAETPLRPLVLAYQCILIREPWKYSCDILGKYVVLKNVTFFRLKKGTIRRLTYLTPRLQGKWWENFSQGKGVSKSSGADHCDNS